MMRIMGWTAVALIVAVLSGASSASGQGTQPLQVGDVAPDFELPAAVRHGVLAEPVSLSDYEGETVVLAFFFRARTKG